MTIMFCECLSNYFRCSFSDGVQATFAKLCHSHTVASDTPSGKPLFSVVTNFQTRAAAEGYSKAEKAILIICIPAKFLGKKGGDRRRSLKIRDFWPVTS